MMQYLETLDPSYIREESNIKRTDNKKQYSPPSITLIRELLVDSGYMYFVLETQSVGVITDAVSWS